MLELLVCIELLGAVGDTAATSQRGFEDIKGNQLGSFTVGAISKLALLPPAHFSHQLGIEGYDRRTSGDAAIMLDEVLLDAITQLLSDSNICHVQTAST